MKRIIPIILLCGWLLCSCSVQRSTEPRRYQTLHQKANATLQLDQHQYTMGSTVQMWRNELIVLSLQPILGIEMVRVEATKDSIWLFDKMNRRYTTLAYSDFEGHIQPTPSYKMIQDFITTTQVPTNKISNQVNFTANEHKLAITCTFTNREYNTLSEPKRLDNHKYKRVSLHEILPL